MNRKYFTIVVWFVLAAFMLLGVALWWQNYMAAGQVRGQYAFANTKNNIRKLNRVQMITAEGEINIYRHENGWRFKEAKDYFVNPRQLSILYDLFNNALIEQVMPVTDEDLQNKDLNTNGGTQIAAYDSNGKLLDAAIIGKREKGMSVYGLFLNNRHYFYVIGPVGAFSGTAADWVPYPLLSIRGDFISNITAHGKIIGRDEINRLQKNTAEFNRVLDVLSFIGYDGIMLKQELENESAKQIKPKKMQIGLAGGLIYEFEIYRIDDDYWLAVNLSRERVAHKDAVEFVKDNQKYFSGWLFLMNKRQGKTLYEW